MADDAVAIRDDSERHRYELLVRGNPSGFLDYRIRDGAIVIMHTEVDRAVDGRGYGSRLAGHALDDARARGLRVIIRCPFVRSYVTGHPEYADLIDRRPHPDR